jgi:hypothetical protein
VKPLLQCVAFLLAAVWLPAAQHCQLEALDIIAAHECHAAGGGAEEAHGKRSHEAPCAHENHNEIEGGAYSLAKDNAGIRAPLLSACVCLACHLHHFLGGIAAAAGRSAGLLTPPPDHRERPQDWVPAWTFVRRAAPSPRAPSPVPA